MYNCTQEPPINRRLDSWFHFQSNSQKIIRNLGSTDAVLFFRAPKNLPKKGWKTWQLVVSPILRRIPAPLQNQPNGTVLTIFSMLIWSPPPCRINIITFICWLGWILEWISVGLRKLAKIRTHILKTPKNLLILWGRGGLFTGVICWCYWGAGTCNHDPICDLWGVLEYNCTY